MAQSYTLGSLEQARKAFASTPTTETARAVGEIARDLRYRGVISPEQMEDAVRYSNEFLAANK